ncbi:hypothetical protein Aperf_G00000041027 [Anoplocephala perfoliata]
MLKEAHVTALNGEKNRAEAFRDKYERLLAEHSKVCKLNSDLEGKLLSLVESFEKERSEFVEKLVGFQQKYAEAEETINHLTASCESYKRDCLIATELLHADPSQFLPANPDNSIPSTRQQDCLSSSTSSEDPLLSNPSHYLLPTTFPPIALYSINPSFHPHVAGNSDGNNAAVSKTNESEPTIPSHSPPVPSFNNSAEAKIFDI